MEKIYNEKNVNKKYSESEILDLISFTGKLVLQNGGEVYRVEDVIKRMGKYYGYEIASFVTLTCIIISIKGENKKYNSIVTRIKDRTLNLNKIHKANTLIRNISNYSIEEFRDKIKLIDNNFFIEKYRLILGNVIIGLSFVIIFGGGLRDSLIGCAASLFIGLTYVYLNKYKINAMLITLIGSAGATSIACATTYLGYTHKTSIIIISCIMTLVPGLAFVNSIRDFIAGDLIAGSSRLMEVLMVATFLAIGTGMIIKTYTSLGGVIY